MFMLIMRLHTSLSMLTKRTFEFSVGVETRGSWFIFEFCSIYILHYIKVGLVFTGWWT